MQQPELGKKIADSRKIKGLTQEELVAKCNLSVRTLQRIETGETTPRIYTIKLIFEVLELDFESLIKTSNIDNTLSNKSWIEQFYNLFNLKTLSTKKVLILSLLILAIIFGLFTIVSKNKNQDKNDISPLDKENKIVTNIADLKINEGDFSCINCFYDNDDMIGYGVKFKKNGVNVDVQLIKLNINTGEFNAGFVKGIFLNNKVEVTANRKWIDQELIKGTADKVSWESDDLTKSKSKLILKGNAKIVSLQNEAILANEIIVFIE